MENKPVHTDESSESDAPVKKDRSLVYMAVGLGIVILVMGYLTLYVDDPWKIFRTEQAPEKIVDDRNTSLLDQSEGMSDDQVRASLVKFIEAFYNDLRRGYFDPPSYFADITETFYNYHNLNHRRLRDIYWRRMADMQNFSRTWIVSSLDFERRDKKITATYWARESYFRPSLSEQYSGDIRYEMVIDEEGKIESLRDIDRRNESVTKIARDTTSAIIELPGSETAGEGSDADIYDMTIVEVAPEFNGGQRELNRYLTTNLKYPATARQNNVQGKVYLGFIVEKDGSVGDVKVRQGIGSGCDEEAVRLLKSSPKWKPGTVSGSPVRTYCVLPVTFQLK